MKGFLRLIIQLIFLVFCIGCLGVMSIMILLRRVFRWVEDVIVDMEIVFLKVLGDINDKLKE